MIRKKPLARAVGLAIAAGSLTAHAQEPAGAAQPVEQIVVTGTRIRQDVFTSTAPLDVITTDTALHRGIEDVGRMLQHSTLGLGSQQVTPALTTNYVFNGGLGVETLSLRGLGANRTLVLLNNRRAGPAGVRGGVSAFDLNVLPMTIIDRIEVLKDGASTIYGSDAIAGVVNIITKQLVGAAVDGYVSAPSRNGGEESRFSVSWGNVAEHSRFQISADFYEQSQLAKGQRSYFSCGEQFVFDLNTGARADLIDPRTGRPHCTDLSWGQVWIYDYQGPGGNIPAPGGGPQGTKAQYDYDGNLGLYVDPFPSDPNNPDYFVAPPGFYPVGGTRERDAILNANHPFHDQASLVPKTNRSTVFAQAELDLSDKAQGYMEFLVSRRKTRSDNYRQLWTYLYNSDSNGFFQSDPLNVGWTGLNYLSPTAITDHNNSSVDVDYRRYVFGMRGDINANWGWDASYQQSDSNGKYHDDVIYDDSIWDQFARTSSCVGTFSSVRGVPCVDIPWLDPSFLNGQASPEVSAYLFGVDNGNTHYTQSTLEGYLSGVVNGLPAGQIGVAAGVQVQKDDILDVPGEAALANNIWNSSTAGVTQGDDSQTSVYGEVDVPLLADKRFARSLSVNASLRHTDTDSYGGETTHKFGINWQITDTVKIRANTGTSFRTPALFELYLGNQTGFVAQRAIDPCIDWAAAVTAGSISQRIADNCAAAGVPGDLAAGPDALVTTGGGYGKLEAETSDSKTIGVVWQPAGVNLSFSADYFEIEIKNGVDQLGADQIVYGCYNSQFYPNDPLCNLFDRSLGAGSVDNVQDSYINIARQSNKGADFALQWQTEHRWGVLKLSSRISIQQEDSKALFPDTVTDYNDEIGDPKTVGQVDVSVQRGDWTYFWGLDYIGSASNYDSYGGNTATYQGQEFRVVLETSPVMYHSLGATRDFKRYGITANFGVANVFDDPPPRLSRLGSLEGTVYLEGNSAFYSQYDWFGRRLYFTVTKSFGDGS